MHQSLDRIVTTSQRLTYPSRSARARGDRRLRAPGPCAHPGGSEERRRSPPQRTPRAKRSSPGGRERWRTWAARPAGEPVDVGLIEATVRKDATARLASFVFSSEHARRGDGSEGAGLVVDPLPRALRVRAVQANINSRNLRLHPPRGASRVCPQKPYFKGGLLQGERERRGRRLEGEKKGLILPACRNRALRLGFFSSRNVPWPLGSPDLFSKRLGSLGRLEDATCIAAGSLEGSLWVPFSRAARPRSILHGFIGWSAPRILADAQIEAVKAADHG